MRLRTIPFDPTRDRGSQRYLLVLGVIVLVAGILLPSPQIEGDHTGFFKHFGGGLFCGFLWLFLYRNAGLRLSVLLELLSLFAVVSILGVGVELVELAGTRIDVLTGSTDDTSWDLLANTSGALSFWVLYRLLTRLRRT